MKYCGNNEEGTEAHPINPCGYLFPAVVGQAMKEGAAHNGRNDEELRERQRKVNILGFAHLRPLLKMHGFSRDDFRKIILNTGLSWIIANESHMELSAMGVQGPGTVPTNGYQRQR